MLHDLLPDHLDVLEALHAADIVHQDVGVGVANTPAAQIQPLLEDRRRETHEGTHKHIPSMAKCLLAALQRLGLIIMISRG